MKRLIFRLTILTCLSVPLAGMALGQRPAPGKRPEGRQPPVEREGRGRMGPPRQGPPFPPPGPGFDILSSEMRFEGKVVTGAPFSAVTETESVQTLADGTRISRKSSGAIYRDGEGRTRREQTLDAIVPFAAANEPVKLIFINDAVTGVHYILSPHDRTARKFNRRPGGPPLRPSPPPDSQGKTESLGRRTIEGVEAEGTRWTISIPTGQIGNDRPLEIYTERWESPELQTIVMSKHSDPRMGETIYRLANIDRSEPSRSMFEIPSDYKVSEGGPPGPSGPGDRGRRGRRPGNSE